VSPQRKGAKRGRGWKPPRDRKEIVVAVLASLAVVVVTAALIWFLRPNRDSGSTTTSDTTATTVAADTTTTVAGATTTTVNGATTTAPPATSTP
jgi:hypothetical protein